MKKIVVIFALLQAVSLILQAWLLYPAIPLNVWLYPSAPPINVPGAVLLVTTIVLMVVMKRRLARFDLDFWGLFGRLLLAFVLGELGFQVWHFLTMDGTVVVRLQWMAIGVMGMAAIVALIGVVLSLRKGKRLAAVLVGCSLMTTGRGQTMVTERVAIEPNRFCVAMGISDTADVRKPVELGRREALRAVKLFKEAVTGPDSDMVGFVIAGQDSHLVFSQYYLSVTGYVGRNGDTLAFVSASCERPSGWPKGCGSMVQDGGACYIDGWVDLTADTVVRASPHSVAGRRRGGLWEGQKELAERGR